MFLTEIIHFRLLGRKFKRA